MLVAEENELLSELGNNVVTQNLSELAERVGEEGERSTEQKYWYADVLATSKTKWRETVAVLAQMCAEHKIERQHWDAERSAECTQWENDSHLWDEACAEKLSTSEKPGRNSS